MRGDFESQAFSNCFSMQHENLQFVSISDCREFNDYNLILLLQNTPNLKSLWLRNLENISNDSLQKIGVYGAKYESIFLSDINQISEETLIVILQNCRRIKQFKLQEAQSYISEIGKLINKHQYNLEYFHLEASGILNPQFLEELTSVKYLKTLIVQYPLSDEELVIILKNCKRLQKLQILDCQNLRNFPIIDKNDFPYPIYTNLKELFLKN